MVIVDSARLIVGGVLDVFGVGIDTAAVLLVTAGDNPERIVTRRAVVSTTRRLSRRVRDRRRGELCHGASD